MSFRLYCETCKIEGIYTEMEEVSIFEFILHNSAEYVLHKIGVPLYYMCDSCLEGEENKDEGFEENKNQNVNVQIKVQE